MIQSASIYHLSEVDFIDLCYSLEDCDLDQHVILGFVVNPGDECQHFGKDFLRNVFKSGVVTFDLGILGYQ